MKYVVLSFDDGDKSFYTRALDTLKKYKLTAVLNVISDYANMNKLEYLSWEEIKECFKLGIEIANHSALHNNEIEDIIRGAKEIRTYLNVAEPIGFASPHSGVYKKNFDKYKCLLENKDVQYIRSGNCVKRDGIFHTFLYLFYKYTKSKKVFRWYNKRNIINLNKKIDTFFTSITCNIDNTIEQVIYTIKKMPKDTACIIMFHQIYKENDKGFKKEKWSNTLEDFETLCKYLSKSEDVSVITNSELLKMIKNL